MYIIHTSQKFATANTFMEADKYDSRIILGSNFDISFTFQISLTSLYPFCVSKCSVGRSHTNDKAMSRYQ